MIAFHRVITKMKRFSNRYHTHSKIAIGGVMLVYLIYTGSIVFFSSHEIEMPRHDAFQAESSTPTSLFLIPKRKFQHATTPESVVQLQRCGVSIAIILCEDDQYLTVSNRSVGTDLARKNNSTKSRPSVAKDFARQINQTLVLLKSIAILTSLEVSGNVSESKSSSAPCVQVLLLADKPTHYQTITNEIKSNWAVEFQQTLEIIDIPVSYPSGSAWMRKLFRPCASLRLFIAELLPSYIDSVIYLDTDVIFFQSVQALWKEFSRFDKPDGMDGTKKIAAMAPCLFHYGSAANSVPYYGSSGLNAGIMLMNLTKMRMTAWTNRIRMVTTMFKEKIKLADQDILNIYFHFFPEELHRLSCDWNFRPFQCRLGSYCEDAQLSHGISVLHGNALSFTPYGSEPMFHSVYQTFLRVQLNKSFNFKRLVDQLERALLRAEEKSHSDCKTFGGLNVLILNRYYDIIERG